DDVLGHESTDGAAVLKDQRRAFLADAVAATVAGGPSIFEMPRRCQRPIGVAVQHLAADERHVPAEEIRRRRPDGAGAAGPATPLGLRSNRWTERARRVPARHLRRVLSRVERRVLHADRREDALPQERAERLTAHLLDDAAENEKVRVAV